VSLGALTRELIAFHSRLFAYNAGVFSSGGAAVLIDPGIYPDEIAAIRNHVAVSGAELTAIVITHSHWDHLLGPEHFPGVMKLQQLEAVAVAHEFGPAIERQVTAWSEQGGATRAAPFVLPEPDETFGDRLEFRVGDTVIELRAAPGHAPEQFVVWHAETGLLWAADMLSDIEIPFVMDKLAAYRRTLDQLAELNVQTLVPGHGKATRENEEIRQRLDEDRRYLAELEGRVGAAVRAGSGVRAAVSDCAGMGFRHRDENMGSHRLNCVTAFYELGGPVESGINGWDRLQ
jgi:hydroxyacylglutathione hydrolase